MLCFSTDFHTVGGGALGPSLPPPMSPLEVASTAPGGTRSVTGPVGSGAGGAPKASCQSRLLFRETTVMSTGGSIPLGNQGI